MSFGQRPQTTTNNPWADMPDWVMEYYRNQVDGSRISDERADELRRAMAENPDAFMPGDRFDPTRFETAHQSDTLMRGALDTAARSSGNIEQLGNAEIAELRRITGMANAADGRLAGINTDLGSAFDTSAMRDTLTDPQFAETQARYEDEHILGVLDPVMSRMREDEARARAGAEGTAAAVGGASNTRAAVEAARLASEGTRDRAQFESQLRSDALRTGQELGMQEVGMRGDMANMAARLGLDESELEANIREASSRLGISIEDARRMVRDQLSGLSRDRFGIGRDVASHQLAEAGLQMQGSGARLGIGEFEMGALDRSYQHDSTRRMMPVTAESWYRDLQSTPLATPLPQSGTTTQRGGGAGIGTQILGAGTSLAGAAMTAGLFSDERVKEDIVPLDGDEAMATLRRQRPSAYSYTDPAYDRVAEPGRRSAGLMAQDLKGIEGAVMEGPGGVKMVDPYPVMATIVAALQRLDERVGEMSHG